MFAFGISVALDDIKQETNEMQTSVDPDQIVILGLRTALFTKSCSFSFDRLRVN